MLSPVLFAFPFSAAWTFLDIDLSDLLMGKSVNAPTAHGANSSVRWQRRGFHHHHHNNNNGGPQLRWHRKDTRVKKEETSGEDNQQEHEASEVKKAGVEQQQEQVDGEKKTQVHKARADKDARATSQAGRVKKRPDRYKKRELSVEKVQEPQEEPHVVDAETERQKKTVVPISTEGRQQKRLEKQQHRQPRLKYTHRDTTRRDMSNQTKQEKRPRTLLKQLLWRVKEVPSAPEPSPEVQSKATSTDNQALSDDDDDNDDDERTFSLHERRSIKMHAVAPKKELNYTLESSSQETQSGSEDEQYACLNSFNLVSHQGVLSSDKNEDMVEEAEKDFPQPFPVDRLLNTSWKVHEVVLEDFSFRPAKLQIGKGDVVVWRVSDAAMAMEEHCIELTFRSNDGLQTQSISPSMTSGDSFAWRFGQCGIADVSCSVYRFHGRLVVGRGTRIDAHSLPKSHRSLGKTKAHRRKSPAPIKKISEDFSDSATESAASDDCDIFHPPARLSKAPEDAGVCESVLSQLSEISSSNDSKNYIMIGEVPCPVGETIRPAEPCGSEANDTSNVQDEVQDFQNQVIRMLQNSERAILRLRDSFCQDESGFDAAAAYDFFKYRFRGVLQREGAVYYHDPHSA